MHTALTFCLGHTLHAVYAALEFEPRVHLVACYAEHDLLVAAEFGLGFVHDLGLPAALVGVHRVHAVEVSSKQRAFLAACTAANLNVDVLLVVRVLGQQQDLQLVLQTGNVAFRLLQLLLRQLLHVRVGQHFGRVRERALCLLVFAERGDDRLEFVALAQQPGCPVRVVV